MIRTIDRYLIRQIIPPFVLSLLVFTFLLQIPPFLEVADKLIAKGTPAGAVARIMATLLPQALGITIPMALLVGLLVAFGRLSADRETVALQACGVSLYRLLRPVLLVSALATTATTWIMIVALPDANQAFREITYGIITTRAQHEVRPRVFFENFPGLVLYVRDTTPDGGVWKDVFLADMRRSSVPDVYLARRGRVHLDPDRRQVAIALEDGARHRLPGDTPSGAGPRGRGAYEIARFEQTSFRLDPETVFPRTGLDRGTQEMTIADLRTRIEETAARGDSPHNYVMALHRKLSIPVACLVFGLLALPLGMSSRKEGRLASFVPGLAVIFFYYVVMYSAEAMAKGDLIPAGLAMWVPNLVVGGAGLALLAWRVSRVDPGPRIGAAATRLGSALRRLLPTRRAPKPAARPRLAVRVPATRFRLPRFSVLDGYVARLYFVVFALSCLGLLGIFYIATFIDLSDKLYKGQATGGQLVSYLWFATPQYVYYLLPLSALVSTLVTIGILTKTSELVVMKACGISLYRVGAPLLLFGALWSGMLFGLGESVLAQSNRRAEEIRHVIRGGSPRTFNLLNRRWLAAGDSSIYHFHYFDERRSELGGLSIYTLDPDSWHLVGRSFADWAGYDGRQWTGRNGWRRTFGASAGDRSYDTFEEQALELEPPRFFATEQPDAERMTYRELARYIDELQASGFNVVPHAVALHRKVSFPFVTVIMTLLAVPFAVTTGSRGAMYGIGIGLALAITYWTVLNVFGAIGAAGLLAPPLAAWSPNLLFLAGAGYLVLSVRT